MSPKRLAILGSTGSIGTQALDVVRTFPERFSVLALSGNNNVDLLIEQALEFRPRFVVIGNDDCYDELRNALASTDSHVLSGQEGLCEIASHPDVDIVLAALVGFAGVESVLKALEAGKTLALANKESLVVAGHLVYDAISKYGGSIIPVDSEHSAIFQCLQGEDASKVDRIILTASGGAFRDRALETFEDITVQDALAHPNWSMGDKITIDSATMMNKGLEVIEAHWLFDMPADKIEVVLHRQSVIHSMVEFHDGSTMAQLGVPDMKVPIQYALTYPDRWPAPNERLDWQQLAELNFESVSDDRYPCLSLAFDALRTGGSMPAALNAANEAAVARFLNGTLPFTRIASAIELAMSQHQVVDTPSLDDLIDTDREARKLMEQNYEGTH